jgi:hypothetical protein
MKVKARLAPMECADNPKKWEKTTEIETPDDLPQEIIDEILDMWKDLKTGRAKDQQAKAKMISTGTMLYMELIIKRTLIADHVSALALMELKNYMKKYSQ